MILQRKRSYDKKISNINYDMPPRRHSTARSTNNQVVETPIRNVGILSCFIVNIFIQRCSRMSKNALKKPKSVKSLNLIILKIF